MARLVASGGRYGLMVLSSVGVLVTLSADRSTPANQPMKLTVAWGSQHPYA